MINKKNAPGFSPGAHLVVFLRRHYPDQVQRV
jgi:hypothetical protein